MKSYSAMKARVREIIDATNFQDFLIFPGPELPDQPERFVVLTRYGGPGLELDGAFDGVSWQVRCVGTQMNYEDVESVADAIDIALISQHSQQVGNVWVPSVQRVGGPPSAIPTQDDADRVHFVCSYTVSVELALPN